MRTLHRLALKSTLLQSLKKSEPPHKLRLAISIKQPNFDVLGSSCTGVAGSLGFCNHAVGLMHLVSHFFMTKIKVIPGNFTSTSLPQQWHKPRRKTISSEPLMDMIFNKNKIRPSQCTGRKSEFLSFWNFLFIIP